MRATRLRSSHASRARRSFAVTFTSLLQVLPAILLAQELPGVWRLEDVGSPTVVQAADIVDGCLVATVTGGGLGLLEDRLAFLHQRVEGDVGIEARFAALVAGGRSAGEVTVQLRGSLEADSPYAAALLDHSGLWIPRLHYRDSRAAPADFRASFDPDPFALPAPPAAFLRLERRGTAFTAYYSRDGKLWVHVWEHVAADPVPAALLAGVSIAGTSGDLKATACELRIDGPRERLPAPRWTVTPTFGFVGEPIAFDASPTLAENAEIVSHRWIFDESETAEGRIVSHVFQRANSIMTSLTVTDALGRSVRRSEPIAVLRPPRRIGEWLAVELYGASRADVTPEGNCTRIVAPGIDFVPTIDTSELLYQRAVGDVILSARVSKVAGGLNGASFGLMLRESLDPRSRYALAMLTTLPGTLEFAFAKRTAWGEVEDLHVTPGIGLPLPQLPDAWLRIERLGDELIGSISPDGSSWFEIGRAGFDPPLDEVTLAGIAVTSQCGEAPGCGLPLDVTFCDATIEGGRSESVPGFRRGDVDASGRVNITDLVSLYNHLFRGSRAGPCEDAADTNDDGQINLSDSVYLLNYLFRGGPPPTAPGVTCGLDANDTDTLAPCATGGCQ